jgi:hypothetical protein
VFEWLATWLRSLDGQAFRWTLVAELLAFLAEVLQKGIVGMQEVLQLLQKGSEKMMQDHPQGFPLTSSDFFEILSVQWQLIAIGLGAILGSFVVTPEEQRNSNVLLVPYAGASIAILVILLIYFFWPWIGPSWLRVFITDVIGVIVIYLCVRAAAKVRNP